MRYKVVAVDINGGQDQTGHEHNQAKCQAAKAIEGRLFGPQRQNQLLLVLENTHTKNKNPYINTSNGHRKTGSFNTTFNLENDLN